MRKIQNVGEVPFEGGRMKDNDEVDTKKNNKKRGVSRKQSLSTNGEIIQQILGE